MQVKRLGSIFEGTDRNLRHIAIQPEGAGNEFHDALPVRLRKLAEVDPQRQIAVAGSRDIHGSVERAGLVELAVHHKRLRVLDWRIGRRAIETTVRVFGSQQGLLVPQLVHDHAERSHLGSAVEPGEVLAQARGGNHVIELCRGRHVGIELEVAVDQHRITLDSRGTQQRSQQCVLVLAIAVAVLQNLDRGMRLVAANAERKADVSNIASHIVVETLRFLGGSGGATRQFFRFLADLILYHHLLALEFGVPVRHLLPVDERGQLDVEHGYVTVVEVLLFRLAVGNKILGHPGVDAAVGALARLILPVGTLQVDRARLGNVDLQAILVKGSIPGKPVFVPELARHQRRGDVRRRLVFQNIPGTQADYAHMLLAVVAVHGSRPEDLGREVLQRRSRRSHRFSTWLADAHIVNIQRFKASVVPENQLPESLHGRFALNADHGAGDAFPGAVVLVTHAVGNLVVDHRFLRSIGR